MFSKNSLRNREAKLAIATLTVLLLALMLAVSARPAHAYQNVSGTDSFAAAQGLLVSPQDPGGGVAVSNYYMLGNTSGATMEVGKPGHTLPIKTAVYSASATACGGK
jgi:hypothetical protein